MICTSVRGLVAVAALGFVLGGCGAPGKQPHDFSFDGNEIEDNGDSKADAKQPKGSSKSLGEIKYGATKSFYHSGYPNFRSVYFDGKSGDDLTIDVSTSDADSEIWLVDVNTKVIGYNDDRSSASYDSRINVKLPAAGRYRILMQEYDFWATTFTVKLTKKASGGGSTPANYQACNKDADCVAIANPACCQSWRKVAVNKTQTAAYNAANKCSAPYPPCAPPPDSATESQNVAQCNTSTKLCEMVAPENIACNGFSTNPHQCPSSWICVEPGNDMPGSCYRGCTYEGTEYLAGDTWKTSDYCNDCSCSDSGQVACTKKYCPACDYTPTTKRRFKYQNPATCESVWFLCKVGEQRFDDYCGCGCEKLE